MAFVACPPALAFFLPYLNLVRIGRDFQNVKMTAQPECTLRFLFEHALTHSLRLMAAGCGGLGARVRSFAFAVMGLPNLPGHGSPWY